MSAMCSSCPADRLFQTLTAAAFRHLRRPRPRLARLERCVAVALTDDPQRFGQHIAGEAAPIARRRHDDVGLDRFHAVDLALVGADQGDLLLDVMGDVDETVGLELHRRGRGLVAVDVGHAAGRHQAGGMDRAMVLVRVLEGMRVDVRWMQLADRRLDDRDRLGAVGDVGVAEVGHLEARTDQGGGVPGLDRADVHVAARRAARQRQDMQHVVVGVVLGERAAAADLDVVGMGADRQHALLLATAADIHGLGQQQDLIDEFRRCHRPEEQAVDSALDRVAQELRVPGVGGEQRGGPAEVVLDVLQQGEAAGGDRRIHSHEIAGCRRQAAHGGLGVRHDFQGDGGDGVECALQRAGDGLIDIDNQYAQPLSGGMLHDGQPRLFL
jgi:hypothetical protein